MKPGRKPLPPIMKRSKVVTLMLTEGEFDRLAKEAERLAQPVGTFARLVIFSNLQAAEGCGSNATGLTDNNL